MTGIGTLRNTGRDTLRDVLTRLEKEGAARGHFNVADQVLLKAVIAAAAETKLQAINAVSPTILAEGEIGNIGTGPKSTKPLPDFFLDEFDRVTARA